MCFWNLAIGQSSWSDDFLDGDFTQNPEWVGETDKFIVNANFELQLNDTARTLNAYLATQSAISTEATWEFKVRYGFNPSAQNHAQIYLMSNTPVLNGPVNGYFVRIGGTTQRRISLFRRNGNTNTVIAESVDNVVNTSSVNTLVKVSRDANHLWTLEYDTSGTGNNFVTLPPAYDNSFEESSFFGFNCVFTTTRFNLFFFDDINVSGKEFVDSIPPQLLSAQLTSDTEVLLTFDEPILPSALFPANFSINQQAGFPAQVAFNQGNADQVLLTLAQPLQPNVLYEVTIGEVEDLAGNIATQLKAQFIRNEPMPFDLIINEIMADPTPPVNLPDREYVEIYNRTDVPQSLDGWRMRVNNSNVNLNGVIAPNSYAIIVREDAADLFDNEIQKIRASMSATILTNAGATVSLFSPDDKLIHSVQYSDTWYGSTFKRNGGWSLEQIDKENFCGGINNWTASESNNGGTPGLPNSVMAENPDTTRPIILYATYEDDFSIQFIFSEEIIVEQVTDVRAYRIEPDLTLLSVEKTANNRVKLDFLNAMQEGLVYQLSFTQLPEDCSGNLFEDDTIKFGKPTMPALGDISINELLPDPFDGGQEYVELYNSSNKIIDLSKLTAGNYLPEANGINNPRVLTELPILFFPDDYLVFVASRRGVEPFYNIKNPRAIIETNAFPTLPNSGGSMALATNGLELIDYVQYSRDMHSPLLRNVKGVSLERILPTSPRNDPSFWRSAAQPAGFGTPGYENSQRINPNIKDVEFYAEPKVFSPNNDGFQDICTFKYRLDKGGYMGSIRIVDLNGIEVARLSNLELLSQEGFTVWQGTGDNNTKLRSGTYIAILDLTHPDGDRVMRKISVGLIY